MPSYIQMTEMTGERESGATELATPTELRPDNSVEQKLVGSVAMQAMGPGPDSSQFSQQITTGIASMRPDKNLGILFECIENGDTRAKDVIAESFMPLARNLAYKFTGGSESFDELTQVANLGLANAINRYDRNKGVPFLPYAALVIKGEIMHHFRDHGWDTHVTRALKDKAKLVKNKMDELQLQNRPSKLQDVAEALEISYDEAVEGWLASRLGQRSISFDAPVQPENSENEPLIDVTPGAVDEDSIIDHIAFNVEMDRILRDLSPRDKEIFVRHIRLDQTQKQTAQAVGVSQMHVSRVIRRVREGA